MRQRRRTSRACLLASLPLIALSLHSPTAYSATSDPPAGSPAGAVYQLPLEQGRVDAAPSGGRAASGRAPDGSLYRTENNFGSSSEVPGLVAAGAGAAVAVGGGDDDAGGGGAAAGDSPGGGRGPAGNVRVADAGNTSLAGGIALLAAIAAIAGGVGVLTRRFGDSGESGG